MVSVHTQACTPLGPSPEGPWLKGPAGGWEKAQDDGAQLGLEVPPGFFLEPARKWGLLRSQGLCSPELLSYLAGTSAWVFQNSQRPVVLFRGVASRGGEIKVVLGESSGREGGPGHSVLLCPLWTASRAGPIFASPPEASWDCAGGRSPGQGAEVWFFCCLVVGHSSGTPYMRAPSEPWEVSLRPAACDSAGGPLFGPELSRWTVEN